jgi:G3E family GTPase
VEVAGGCFCCRCDDLVKATEALISDISPEVIIAEPVGSCTDLKATVSIPVKMAYQKDYAIAPLSILVDPFRASRILQLERTPPPAKTQVPGAGGFSADIEYVYRKQIDEADIIVLNKSDLLPPERLQRLEDALRERYHGRVVLSLSARTGAGTSEWLDLLVAGDTLNEKPLDIDYAAYGRGEALLGWLNASYRVARQDAHDDTIDGGVYGSGVNANELLLELSRGIRDLLESRHVEVAHLKMSLSGSRATTGSQEMLSVVQLVSTEGEPEITVRARDQIDSGTLVVNLRAEVDPETLREVVITGLREIRGVIFDLKGMNAFRPAQPNPTHRMGRHDRNASDTEDHASMVNE